MFKTNEYFDGNVKSIAFSTVECPATVGVMAPGEYQFGTSSVEYMTVTSGELFVQLPGESEWKTYKPFEQFIVPKGIAFLVKTETDTSYLCLYK
jgi:uncharacterized protein YaiE (UPF0345 family)